MGDTDHSDDELKHRKKKKKGKSRMQKQKSSFGRLAEHVLGYAPNKDEEHKSSLPPGYTIGYSKNGHPYLVKLNDTSDGADAEAANEHKRIHYPLSVDKEILGNRFGVGIYLYFDYLIYLIYTNIVLLVLGVIAFAIHASKDTWGDGSDNTYGRFSFFFYDDTLWKESRKEWLWICIIAAIFWFLFGPIYSKKIQRYFKKRERDSATDLGEINFEEYIDAEDFIKANEHITHQGRICRIAVGYVIFVLVLVLSTIATFFLIVLSTSRKIEDLDTSSLLISAIIAVFMTSVNMVWKRVCVWLTQLEGHATWTKFRQHNTLKFFLFKMLNVLTMYASRILAPRNMWEIFLGWARAKMAKKRGMLGKGSNDSVRPEFDLAEEYLELIYRQFIIYLAFSIIPLVPILGLIANLVEYRIDKYRLLRICQHPRGLQGSMRNFLTFFLFTTAAVALASPPYGMAWVLSGQSQSMCSQDTTET